MKLLSVAALVAAILGTQASAALAAEGLPGATVRADGNGNPPFAVDFRDLYATVLERWWGVDAARALNGRFAPLDVLKA